MFANNVQMNLPHADITGKKKKSHRKLTENVCNIIMCVCMYVAFSTSNYVLYKVVYIFHTYCIVFTPCNIVQIWPSAKQIVNRH